MPKTPDCRPSRGDEGTADGLPVGSAAYRRAAGGLFLAGFATFAMLYCAQAMLPALSAEFGVAPATSALALSITTATLAPMLLVVSPFSDAWGRKGILVASLFASAGLTIAVSWTEGFAGILALRALTGIALSGVPSISMAYLGEEAEAKSIGLATGLLIAGNAVGGMTGRVGTGLVMDYASWRWAAAGIGSFALIAGILVWRILPASRRFQPRPLSVQSLGRAFADHLGDRDLRRLFALAFLLMGSFVTIYNYIGYRLLATPFGLGQAAVGAIFSLYLVGIVSSTVMGQVADRLGRWRALLGAVATMLVGVALTLPDDLPLVIAGVAVVTFGFFGAHSIASSWVARRASFAKAQAASLYLFAYYGGSSVIAWIGGYLWSSSGWPGVIGMVATLVIVAAALAASLPSSEAGAPDRA